MFRQMLNWTLYGVLGTFLTFEPCYKILHVTIQMKATEQYFPVVRFIMLFKVVLAFESVGADEILKFDLSNDSFWAVLVLSCGTVYHAMQDSSNF